MVALYLQLRCCPRRFESPRTLLSDGHPIRQASVSGSTTAQDVAALKTLLTIQKPIQCVRPYRTVAWPLCKRRNLLNDYAIYIQLLMVTEEGNRGILGGTYRSQETRQINADTLICYRASTDICSARAGALYSNDRVLRLNQKLVIFHASVAKGNIQSECHT